MTKDTQNTREWYSVSYTSVAMVGFVALAIVAVLLYRYMDFGSIENQAERKIDEAKERYEIVSTEVDIDIASEELKSAQDLLDEAVKEYDEENYERALETANRSIIILAGLETKGEGSIRVLSAQGNVEYRRGERGSWKRLRNHDNLTPGDWVKTSTNATALLLFSDKSKFTLRQDTMVHLGGALGLGGKDKSTNVHNGTVELNTSQSDQTVTTPGSQARIRSDSEALVSFDQQKGAGRFATFSGEVKVTSEATGETRTLSSLQQVDMIGEKLSETRSLPGKPRLTGPGVEHSIDLSEQSEVVLAWDPVDETRRYSLLISGNRLFADVLIEDKRRSKTSARVKMRREGQFYWKVAALDAQGNAGPWSETGAFRGISGYVEQVSDKVPPYLKIIDHAAHGTVVIINGKTESGAAVKINDDPVAVNANGTFRQTVILTEAGKNIIKIVATDVWDNATTKTLEVFIDA